MPWRIDPMRRSFILRSNVCYLAGHARWEFRFRSGRARVANQETRSLGPALHLWPRPTTTGVTVIRARGHHSATVEVRIDIGPSIWSDVAFCLTGVRGVELADFGQPELCAKSQCGTPVPIRCGRVSSGMGEIAQQDQRAGLADPVPSAAL
jgi:hypothetical protein